MKNNHENHLEKIQTTLTRIILELQTAIDEYPDMKEDLKEQVLLIGRVTKNAQFSIQRNKEKKGK
tara:strand:- start:323 stop:517 length:195 start_codon:yes stop_codon:yes gene_type:complete